MKKIDRLIEIVCVVLVVEIVAIIFMQVFLRYLFASPFVWADEWNRYSLVWLTFLGSYIALRRHKHIKMEIGYSLVPKSVRRIFNIIGNIAIAVFALYMINFGWGYSTKLMNTWPQSFPIPMGLFYMIIPMAGGLFLLNSLYELVLIIKPAAGQKASVPADRR